MPSGPSICAKRAAEARPQPSSSTVRGWALAQSSVVLRGLTLAIPQRSLTAVVGDIGSGKHLFSCSKNRQWYPGV